jgi:UTP--glucose-1-phosphate uridylyltransferase
LLLLGDHIYSSAVEKKSVEQLMDAYEKSRESMVSVIPAPAEDIGHYGCIGGKWLEDHILTVTEFAEKPEVEYARDNLQVEGLEEDTFLTLYGQYILTPRIFHYLEESITHDLRERGEFQLTGCLEKLRQEEGFFAYLVSGSRFDIGDPAGYRNAFLRYDS